MTTYDDRPISNPEQDEFNFYKVANSISTIIVEDQASLGLTISINGPWGSGKSSIAKLIKNQLDENAAVVRVAEFETWTFSGEQALTRAFYELLDAEFEVTFGEKIEAFGEMVKKTISTVGPIVAEVIDTLIPTPIAKLLIKTTVKASEYKIGKSQTFQELRKELVNKLEEANTKLLVVIDDIDRLVPKDLVSIFRVVNTVGNLPNVVYLMLFDKKQAEECFEYDFHATGSEFLEKLIQLEYEVPQLGREEITNAIYRRVFDILDKENSIKNDQYFHDVIHGCVVPFIRYPRDIIRISKSVEAKYRAIGEEVNFADLLAMETLRIIQPEVFTALFEALLDEPRYGREEHNSWKHGTKLSIEKLLKEKNKIFRTLKALDRIFPQLNNTTYADFWNSWDKSRRVCCKRHLLTYLRNYRNEEVSQLFAVNLVLDNLSDKAILEKTVDLLFDESSHAQTLEIDGFLHELRLRINDFEPKSFANLFAVLINKFGAKRERNGNSFLPIGKIVELHYLFRRALDGIDDVKNRDALVSDSMGKIEPKLRLAVLSNLANLESNEPALRSDSSPIISLQCFGRLVRSCLSAYTDFIFSAPDAEHHALAGNLFTMYAMGKSKEELIEITSLLLNNPTALYSIANAHMAKVNSWGSGEVSNIVAKSRRELRVDGLSDYVEESSFIIAIEIALESRLDVEIRDELEVFLNLYSHKNV